MSQTVGNVSAYASTGKVLRLSRWSTEADGLAIQTTLAFSRAWHHVSARDRVLGKLAVNIATVLMGKHKPGGIYDQSIDAGDYVVVTDAKRVVVTGKKAEQKVYYRHSMYPGGLKETKYADMMEKKPEDVSLFGLCSSLSER